MLISIFSKDESIFLCKGYKTILDQIYVLGCLLFFSIKCKKKTYAFCNTITSLYRTNILYTGFAM